MRHRAALAGAALALGAFGLTAGPGSAATVGILPLVDVGCCSISDGSKSQNDPTGGPVTVNEVGNDGPERADDSLGPDAVAIKESGGVGDDTADGLSSVAAPEPSVLTRVLMIFADLRATVLGGPNPASSP
jgi:hypothetical protein